MSQESVVALLTRVREDEAVRTRLLAAESTTELRQAALKLGFDLDSNRWSDQLTDADLDGISSDASDRTCYGTTDCCHTKRTCHGTTDCCR